MIFSTEEKANEAIEKLSAGISIEDFEGICDDLGGSFTDYENYTEGALSSDDLDEWLYDDSTEKGAYTAKAIKLEESQYAVVIWYGDGDAEWYVACEQAIYTERYETMYADLKEQYTVEIKDKVIARIDG